MVEQKPLQVRAYDYIKAKILNGELQFDTLYSETKIAKEMGISRTPMRDAIQYLAQQHYIDIIPNKGFILHKMSIEDFMDTAQIRCAIEGFAARELSRTRNTPQGVATLATLKQLLSAQASATHVDDFLHADTAFHGALVHSVGNSEFSTLFEIHMYQMFHLARTSLHHPGRMAEALEEHTSIVAAIQVGDGAKAYEQVMRHMENPRNISIAQQL